VGRELEEEREKVLRYAGANGNIKTKVQIGVVKIVEFFVNRPRFLRSAGADNDKKTDQSE